MVQPNGLTRKQRRTTSVDAPFGYNRKGAVRVVARGTGFEKVFGIFNIPAFISNAVKNHKAKKLNEAAAIQNKIDTTQVPPSGTVGFD